MAVRSFIGVRSSAKAPKSAWEIHRRARIAEVLRWNLCGYRWVNEQEIENDSAFLASFELSSNVLNKRKGLTPQKFKVLYPDWDASTAIRTLGLIQFLPALSNSTKKLIKMELELAEMFSGRKIKLSKDLKNIFLSEAHVYGHLYQTEIERLIARYESGKLSDPLKLVTTSMKESIRQFVRLRSGVWINRPVFVRLTKMFVTSMRKRDKRDRWFSDQKLTDQEVFKDVSVLFNQMIKAIHNVDANISVKTLEAYFEESKSQR